MVAHPGGYVGTAFPWLLTSDPEGTSWTTVDLEADFFACPESLAVRGSAVVAVGGDGACHSGGGSMPAAWYSTDGHDWSGATINDPEERGGSFGGVVAGPAGFVAWPGAGAPWVSADGTSWAPVADQEPFALSYVTRIVSGGPGLVAIGFGSDSYESGPSGAVIWTSPDGQTWDRIDEGLPFDFPAETYPRIDIGGGGSRLVVWESGNDVVPATRLWSSADGVTWQPMPEIPVPWWDAVARISLFGDELIAFGWREVAKPGITQPCTKDQYPNRCHQAAAIWLGGPDWELLPESAIPDGDGIVGMLARPTGLLAFGSAAGHPAMWSSVDGRMWSRLSLSLSGGR